MTTNLLPPPPAPSARTIPAGSYSLLDAIKAEWMKFRTVRSSLWCLGIFTIIMVGFSALFCAVTVNQWGKHPEDVFGFDPLTASLAGVTMGSLAIGVLGVMVVSAEYSTGSIRATFAAIPHRSTVMLAKVLVLATVLFITAAVAELIAFFLGQAILSTGHAATLIGQFPATHIGKPPTVSLGSHGVLAGLLATDCYLTTLAIVTLGLGILIRHTAGASSAFVGVLFPLFLIVALLPTTFKDHLQKFLPLEIQQTVVVSKPVVSATSMSMWHGVIAMALYAVVLVGAGIFFAVRRDA